MRRDELEYLAYQIGRVMDGKAPGSS